MRNILIICCLLCFLAPARASSFMVIPENRFSYSGAYLQKDPRIAAMEKKLGRRMTLREKILFRITARNLNRKTADPEAARRNGVISMMAGIGSFLFLILRATAPLTPLLALIAVIFGIISLRGKKDKNTPAVVGLILGSGYILIALIAIATLNHIL